jgi:branched-chain amino acid transport system ATP-binding protein
MGRNGMGKTTLIRSLIGHVEPRHGEVKINGLVMTGAPPHLIARQGIAYVPEGRGIFPNLSVRENLIMAAGVGPNGRRRWTYERVLETFPRLSERLSLGGQQLSGGEQQMLTIGRTLMTNPSVLLLDEPWEGLAPIIVEELTAAVRRMAEEEGTALILVEQHAEAALRLTKDAVLLERGVVARHMPSAELLADGAALDRYLGLKIGG